MRYQFKLYVATETMMLRLWDACAETLMHDIMYRCCVRVVPLSKETITFSSFCSRIKDMFGYHACADVTVSTRDAKEFAIQVMCNVHLYVAKRLSLTVLKLPRKPPTFAKLMKAMTKIGIFDQLRREISEHIRIISDVARDNLDSTRAVENFKYADIVSGIRAGS